MPSVLVLFLVLFLPFLHSLPTYAETENLSQTTQAHSTAELISEHMFMYPGENYYLGFKIKLEPQWHTYWMNPGDSAAAPTFNFKPIEGVKVGAPIFPAPTRFQVGPFYSFGYKKEVLIQFPVEVHRRSQLRRLPFELSAEWLVCKEECIPAYFDFQLTIPSPPPMIIESEQDREYILKASLNQNHKDVFHKYRQQWAQPLEASHIANDHFLSLTFDKSIEVLDIFPYPEVGVSQQPPEVLTSEDPTKQTYQFKIEESDTAKKDFFKFLITYKNPDGELRSFKTYASVKTLLSEVFFMLMLGFAGGLILNLMPCVFPVLMLKVFQVLQAQKEQKAFLSAAFYTLGVLVSFWVLAGLIISLQAAGQLVGWGFQLQSPVFILFLILLFIAMSIYFLDIIPFPNLPSWGFANRLGRKTGVTGAFFTGVLAVVVASPCTAPFMGAAMGYALSRSMFDVLAIFTSLGLGLSFPFLLIGIFPKSLYWLPQPGPWMSYLKKALALPLLATVIWLSWVLLQIVSPPSNSDKFWKTYSSKKVERVSAERPVFVNFTAAWCISCQVNDRLAFQKPAFRNFVKDQNIATYKADWTQKNPKLAQVLQSYGRAGVPLYLFFVPGQEAPLILPEVLTSQSLIQILDKELKSNQGDRK